MIYTYHIMADSQDSPSPVTTPTQQPMNKDGPKLLPSSHEQGASDTPSLSTTPTQSQLTSTIMHGQKEASQSTIHASQGQGSYLSVRSNAPPAQVCAVWCRSLWCSLRRSPSCPPFFSICSLHHEWAIE